MKKIKLKVLICCYINIFLVCVLNLIVFSEPLNKVIALMVLALSVALIFKFKDDFPMFLLSIFIAYCNYSIVVGIYLFPQMRPRFLYPQITSVDVYGIGISLIFLFMLSLIILVPVKKNTFPSSDFIKEQNYNPIIFIILTVLFLLIIAMGYTRLDGKRGGGSTLYEYATILLILMFYYSGGRKNYKIITCAAGTIYILNSFLNGTRIEAVTCAIILCLCIVRKKINLGIVILCFIAAITGMNIIGTFRGNWNASLGDMISMSFHELVESKLVFDTCTHAYFPMICMIERFKEFSFTDAGYYFVKFLETILLGVSRVEDGNLIDYVGKFYYHNQGGVTLGFFYVWFSYFAGLIMAVYIRLLNKLSDPSQRMPGYKKCLYIYFIATVPRWYLYGPWSMTRGILVCFIGFGAFKLLENFIRNLKSHRSF